LYSYFFNYQSASPLLYLPPSALITVYIFYVVHVHPHPRKFKISASNVYQCVTGFFKNPFVPSLAYDVYDTSNFVLFFQCRNSIGVFQLMMV